MDETSRWVRPGWRLALLAGALVLAGAATAGSATHTYDSLGRLSQVTYSNGVVITYVYDAAGNRTSYVVTGAPS
ncbi:RHS repeat domain-containing protein [Alicycliphilus sp. T452]|jgi:YD repeat-containing protein